MYLLPLLFLAVGAPRALAQDQTINLTRCTCQLPCPTGGNQVCLAGHWQNSNMLCTFNAATFSLATPTTTCGTDSNGFGDIVVVTDDGTNTTTTTTRCLPTLTMNSNCSDQDPHGAATFTTNSVVIPDGPPPGGPGGDPCLGGGGGFAPGDPGSGPAPDCSPIIIDTAGEGFHLTSAENGVSFDIRGNGRPVQIAWTDPAYRNGFLALDRNHNGTIDNGTELFGNFTAQAKSATPNGFLALAEFDKPENGGNGDGIIDARDAVFSHLVVWIDENHDGISQPNELHSLADLGIFSISLKYQESRRTDAYGNIYRYRAKANPDENGATVDLGRWAYDVFLTTK